MSIPRGKYLGTPDKPVADESEHYIKCAVCGGYIDCRDLGQVFSHEGPGAEHPKQDMKQ